MPLSEEPEMDRVYGLPYTRRPHPSYGNQRIPAFEVVKDSVQIMRGCFGVCTFCSITAHEGRIIQSRSPAVDRLTRLEADGSRIRSSRGVISDIGGPTANMYRMNCSRPRRAGQVPAFELFAPDDLQAAGDRSRPLLELMKAARELPGIKRVLVASGIRMDLALLSPKYLRELAEHHVGGLLKVAPEHTDREVLDRMKKPPIECFAAFDREFRRASTEAGKRQFLVPYFIAGHPGCDLAAMIDLASFLKRTGYEPDKVQDYIPLPMDLATCMYYTGIDPMTGDEVYVPRTLASGGGSGRCCSTSSPRTTSMFARHWRRPGVRTSSAASPTA